MRTLSAVKKPFAKGASPFAKGAKGASSVVARPQRLQKARSGGETAGPDAWPRGGESAEGCQRVP